jgi:hypothetical protein
MEFAAASFFAFVIWVGFGLACAGIANHKGRSPIAWFLFGFFFHIIAVVIALVVTNRKELEGRFDRSRDRVERVREELRQERIKNETFRTEAGARLDAHDQIAGVDTRAEGALAAGLVPPPLPQIEGPTWYFEYEGQARGPEPESALRLRIARGELERDTLVWKEGLSEWVPAETQPQLLA